MNGNTPLHYAAEGGFADCCRYIGQRGTLKLSYFATIIYILFVLKERFHLGISERFDSWVTCGKSLIQKGLTEAFISCR